MHGMRVGHCLECGRGVCARTLLEFWDEEMESGSHSWNVQNETAEVAGILNVDWASRDRNVHSLPPSSFVVCCKPVACQWDQQVHTGFPVMLLSTADSQAIQCAVCSVITQLRELQHIATAHSVLV